MQRFKAAVFNKYRTLRLPTVALSLLERPGCLQQVVPRYLFINRYPLRTHALHEPSLAAFVIAAIQPSPTSITTI